MRRKFYYLTFWLILSGFISSYFFFLPFLGQFLAGAIFGMTMSGFLGSIVKLSPWKWTGWTVSSFFSYIFAYSILMIWAKGTSSCPTMDWGIPEVGCGNLFQIAIVSLLGVSILTVAIHFFISKLCTKEILKILISGLVAGLIFDLIQYYQLFVLSFIAWQVIVGLTIALVIYGDTLSKDRPC